MSHDGYGHGLFAKISGSWYKIKSLYVKASAAWKTIHWLGQKASSTWCTIHLIGEIPETLIGLFEGVPGGYWQICDGTSPTPDLDGLYPRGSDSEGTATGSHTHQHDTYAASSGYCNQRDGSGGITSNNKTQNHTHWCSHQHAAADHQPSYTEIIPAIANGAGYLPMGTILWWTGAVGSIPSGWAEAADLENEFFKFNTSAAGGTGGGLHSHAYTGYSNYAGSPTYSNGTTWNAVFAANHRHTINHTHSSYTNNPQHIELIPIRATTDIFSVASGIVAFFIGSSVPDGWSLYSAADDEFIKNMGTVNETSSGSTTHTHGSQAFTSGSAANSGANANVGGSTYVATSHNHSITHGHSDAQSILPRHISLLICKKT